MRKKIFIFTILFIIFAFFSIAPSEDKDNFQFKKQPEIQQIKPKKPVKIRVKRSGDGKYSWELSGDDADEIAATDKKLQRLLKTE